MLTITGNTKLLGIIGDPVEHSLSPLMHNVALEKLKLDYIYLPFPVKVANLEQALGGFAVVSLVGFNATIPHKQAIMPFLQHITPEATAIGAVNTVWHNKDGWYGTNTDIIGFVAPLKNINRDWSNTTPVVLGNGGAARAVVAGLEQLGCKEINIVGRNKDKLAQFWKSWQNSPQIQSILKIHNWENLSGLLPKTDLLVNTTPIGMHPHIDASPVSAELMQKLPQNAIAYDLIYTPSPTQFLQLAQDNGAKAIDGLEMLLQQGVAALEIWLKQSIPIDVIDAMGQALQEKLYGN